MDNKLKVAFDFILMVHLQNIDVLRTSILLGIRTILPSVLPCSSTPHPKGGGKVAWLTVTPGYVPWVLLSF